MSDGIKLRVLSLGAGVQSTTLALMAAHGEAPMPDLAVFADTQWEPRATYDHLSWLMSGNVLPFGVWKVTRGSLRKALVDRRNTSGGRFAAIPWWTINPDGSRGMGRRQCTSEYKLEPIMRAVRELLGKERRERIAANSVEVMIGISLDEAQRMKPARQQYMRNVFPLIDLRMTRHDCVRWLERHDYPTPPKSACIGCPFHSDIYWRDLRDNRPIEWADAVDADRQLRLGEPGKMRPIEFMHRSCVPLDEVDLSTAAERGQPDLFGNECEGMCGV